MKQIDFTYQEKAADEVLKNALNNNYIASVLAACPNSGKTTISHIIISKYLKLFPNAKIVVLTEGQNTLKNQYLNELDNPNVPINFTYSTLDSNAQVRVGIPQSIDKLTWDKIDLLIVDECHNYYLEKMDQKIISRFEVKHQIIMTGSPSKFNLHNKDNDTKYGVYYISAEELQENGIFSAVNMNALKVVYKKNAKQTIKEILNYAIKNNEDLSKIMVACPSINYAKQVMDYLISIDRKVSLSTSKNDKDNEEIQRFRDGETDVLVIVDRGVLGFNDKNITFLADLKSSDNVDSSFQLFARVLRTHPKDIRKAYYRVTDKGINDQVFMLHKIASLMRKDIFCGYNGRNLKIEFY